MKVTQSKGFQQVKELATWIDIRVRQESHVTHVGQESLVQRLKAEICKAYSRNNKKAAGVDRLPENCHEIYRNVIGKQPKKCSILLHCKLHL